MKARIVVTAIAASMLCIYFAERTGVSFYYFWAAAMVGFVSCIVVNFPARKS